MDSTKRDNKEVQEKLMALQKEKDQVRKETITCIFQLYVYQLMEITWPPAAFSCLFFPSFLRGLTSGFSTRTLGVCLEGLWLLNVLFSYKCNKQ